MRIAAILVVAASTWACAGAEAMTAPPAAKPASGASELGLFPGETMAFEIRLAGMLAGEAQLAVGELGEYEGQPALVVKSRAATAGAVALLRNIVDEATTVIDIASGRPLALETRVEQSGKRTTATATFTGNVAEIKYVRSEEAAPQLLKIDLGKAAVYDAHAAMAQLRGWRAEPSAARSVYVIGGRRLWRIELTYDGEDTIGSPSGNRRAHKFTGSSFRVRRDLTSEPGRPSRTFSVWLSADADRVPLRLAANTELGDIIIELTEYNRPSYSSRGSL